VDAHRLPRIGIALAIAAVTVIVTYSCVSTRSPVTAVTTIQVTQPIRQLIPDPAHDFIEPPAADPAPHEERDKLFEEFKSLLDELVRRSRNDRKTRALAR